MLALAILAGLIIIAGFGAALASKTIVKRYGLDKRIKLENEHEMDEEEANDYRALKASVSVKMYGMLAALPGLVLLVIALK